MDSTSSLTGLFKARASIVKGLEKARPDANFFLGMGLEKGRSNGDIIPHVFWKILGLKTPLILYQGGKRSPHTSSGGSHEIKKPNYFKGLNRN